MELTEKQKEIIIWHIFERGLFLNSYLKDKVDLNEFLRKNVSKEEASKLIDKIFKIEAGEEEWQDTKKRMKEFFESKGLKFK